MAVHPSRNAFVYALFPNVKKISDISSKRVYSFLTFAEYSVIVAERQRNLPARFHWL